MRLREKVAVVTGAGRGNGRAIALGFAREGAAVIVADVAADLAADTVAEIERSGGRAIATTTDVTNREQVDAMTAAGVAAFGKIDVLVNNAGIMVGAPFLEMPAEMWMRTIDVNLHGVFHCAQSVGRVMERNGGGVIINISSNAANKGGMRLAGYGATKGAVRTFTKALANELAPLGIRVNDISPGFLRTELTREALSRPGAEETRNAMIPLGRVGTPEDLVGAAIFLASDESAYITGESLTIDGGLQNMTLPRPAPVPVAAVASAPPTRA